MLPVTGVLKNYHWGRVDSESTLAAIVNSSPWKRYSIERDLTDLPLAELWLGTHPSGMARVIAYGRSIALADFLKADPSLCGDVDHIKKFGPTLPYLFKVLSVNQALSLQAHPNKDIAKALHREDPENYPDPNHKPEMAIALSDFEMLCDVRKHDDIEYFIRNIDPLQQVIGAVCVDKLKSAEGHHSKKVALALCFAQMLRSPQTLIAKELKNLMTDHWLDRLPPDIVHVLRKLYRLYPADPGCFSAFFLNFIRLKPGQAVYLEPMSLHAYIHGDCIECMACSDNVARAGLTSKHCDVETLTAMLEFEPTTPEQLLLKPHKDNKMPQITTYAPPADEFKVDKIVIDRTPEHGEFVLPARSGASILIVLQGTAEVIDFFEPTKRHKLELGFTGFIPPQLSVTLNEIHDTLTAFRAYY